MRWRTIGILTLFVGITLIDMTVTLGDWWFHAKIFIIWGAIFFDAFSDDQASSMRKLLTLIGSFGFIYLVDYMIRMFVY